MCVVMVVVVEWWAGLLGLDRWGALFRFAAA